MNFKEFEELIHNNKSRPSNWKNGFYFMYELSKVRPKIAKVYKGSVLDPSKFDYINTLIWNITKSIWNDKK